MQQTNIVYIICKQIRLCKFTKRAKQREIPSVFHAQQTDASQPENTEEKHQGLDTRLRPEANKIKVQRREEK